MLLMAETDETKRLPDDLMLAKQAAKEFNIPYPTIQAWWRRGAITPYHRGHNKGRVLVRRSDIERMATAREG